MSGIHQFWQDHPVVKTNVSHIVWPILYNLYKLTHKNKHFIFNHSLNLENFWIFFIHVAILGIIFRIQNDFRKKPSWQEQNLELSSPFSILII